MDKKLTLSLDQSVIEKAKIYARTLNISLSKLIESYLAALTNQEENDPEITPFVRSQSGVIDSPDNFDEKEAYTQYLIEKYR